MFSKNFKMPRTETQLYIKSKGLDTYKYTTSLTHYGTTVVEKLEYMIRNKEEVPSSLYSLNATSMGRSLCT